MTQLALKRDHVVVSISRMPEAGVLVVSLDFLSFLIVGLLDGKAGGTRLSIALSTPYPSARAEGIASGGKVGAEDPAETRKGNPAFLAKPNVVA